MQNKEKLHSVALWVLGSILLSGSVGYLILKVIFIDYDPIDFNYIWLAGHMCTMGENPYTPLFRTMGEQIAVGSNQPTFLFYPPSWWFISHLSSYVSHGTAGKLWRGFSVLFLFSGTWVLVDGLKKAGIQVMRSRWVGFLSFACLMSATPICLSYGNTSLLIFLGMALFIRAYLLQHQGLMVVALFILMLKPNIGVLFGIFLLVQPIWYRTLFFSGVAVIAAMIPAFLISGLVPTVSGFIGNLGAYAKETVNLPSTMTGVRFLADDLAGLNLSPFLLAGCGGAVIILLYFLISKGRQAQEQSLPETRLMLLISVLVTVSIFIPLHMYDFTFISLVILLAIPFKAKLQLWLLLPLGLIFRSKNLGEQLSSHMFQSPYWNDAFINTLAVLMMMATILVTCTSAFLKREK